ncbi:MAG: hypothetical protein CO012_08005 [Syntrophobacterales bacterium CG_4_8_14_3_um_filter_49_14]|nr:MAG: hypothetical protein COX52_11050 [Syntrophobacterales bacterium CG23_combo_of_CG06-09_8_20_14_all_48_27]PJA49835.1 MAG: hypothetical protein CO171_04195 [Syntrophobacterales bacterium CG_4_9_14_3_um_filter_49_8]PJC73858.1 MAG: hypothetical protein CO012_08005 [Syntrophobacterales bacterium CG_4_8_14_3_um_filter_49_14]
MAEDTVGLVRKKLLFKVLAEKGLLDQFPVFVLLHDGIAFFSRQFRGDFRPRVYDNRIEQVPFAHALNNE